MSNAIHSTTVLCVIKDGVVCMAADGQVSQGNTVLKGNAKKLRVLCNGTVIVGFAGSVTDCLTLVDRLDEKLQKFNDMRRAAFELAKDWRMDKYIKELEASIIIASKDGAIMLSGHGNIVEPEDNIISVGSGSLYAMSAAKALYQNTDFSAEKIVRLSMKIASDTCVFTNDQITLHIL
jgi:ATP-dependent HslUV protease, peptidase subunit HslV